jgi:hypothetical protein
MSRFAETRPHVYAREDLEERAAHDRAVVLGLVCALISVLLSVGAIASLMLAWG